MEATFKLIILFDLLFRGVILLGAVIVIISGFTYITKNRKKSESYEKIKYYNNYFLQEFPLFSSYMISILTALSIFRVGTLLHITESKEVTFGTLGTILISNADMKLFETPICIVSGLGALIYMVFVVLNVLAVSQLGDQYTLSVELRKNCCLKTDQMYGIIRHPQYLFEILIPIAASVALFSWTLLLWAVCVHLPLYIWRAHGEDEMLEDHYGVKFIDYANKVGAFIPKIKK